MQKFYEELDRCYAGGNLQAVEQSLLHHTQRGCERRKEIAACNELGSFYRETGRASCQDDRATFEVMRSSQPLAWSEEMLDSYARDLRDARLVGRNLLAEKYGYMMERTSPLEFERIRGSLPPITAEKRALIDHICAAHMVWWKELNERYPALTGRGRSGDREDDGVAGTSFETYLRGGSWPPIPDIPWSGTGTMCRSCREKGRA